MRPFETNPCYPWLIMALSLAAMNSRLVYRPDEQPEQLREAFAILEVAGLVTFREQTWAMLTIQAVNVRARLRKAAVEAVPLPDALLGDDAPIEGPVVEAYNRAVAAAEASWPCLLIEAHERVLLAAMETVDDRTVDEVFASASRSW